MTKSIIHLGDAFLTSINTFNVRRLSLMMSEKYTVPLWHKMTLTIQEASELSGIGEKKLRQIVTAVADGAIAAHEAEEYLAEIK